MGTGEGIHVRIWAICHRFATRSVKNYKAMNRGLNILTMFRPLLELGINDFFKEINSRCLHGFDVECIGSQCGSDIPMT